MKKATIIGSAIAAAGAVAGGLLYARSLWHPPVPRIKKGKRHIACVGDSITFGAGVIGKRRTSTYPAYLQKCMGPEYQVLNYGLSGRTLLDEGDMPYRNEKMYAASLGCKADIYIIMLGTNDAKTFNWNAKAYEEQLGNFLRVYKNAAGSGRVYAMKPPKCFVAEGQTEVMFDIQDDVIEQEVGGIVERAAAECGAGVIDLFALTQGHPEWFADGVHPNAVGNRRIAEHVYREVFS